jgi:anti-sigma factor RsiW
MINCQWIRNRITPHMDGELNGDEMRRVSHHIAQCKACSDEFNRLVQVKRLLAHLPTMAPSKQFEERLLATVKGQSLDVSRPNANSFPVLRWAFVFAGAAAAAFAIIALLAPQPQPPIADESTVPGNSYVYDRDWQRASDPFSSHTVPASLESSLRGR